MKFDLTLTSKAYHFMCTHVDVNLADGTYELVPEDNFTKPEEEVEELSVLDENLPQDSDANPSLTANPAAEGKPRFPHNPNFKVHLYECL
jgi:hypothetical protein